MNMKRVLIVTDMQNDFIDGALGSSEAQAIVEPMVKYLEAVMKDSEVRICATRDTHKEETYMQSQEGRNLPVIHCIEGTCGWQISDRLSKLIPEENIINKLNFGLPQADWKAFLGDDIDEVTIVGVCTDICVVSNAFAIKALYPEIPIYVIPELCAGVTPKKHEAALETMRSCQIYMKEI